MTAVCEVCRSEPAETSVESKLYPSTFMIGAQCLERQAEVEGAFQYVFERANDDARYLANFPQGEPFSAMVDPRGVTTFKDGRYVTWEEWSADKPDNPFPPLIE